MKLEVLPDAEAAARRGAEAIAQTARAAITDRGRFSLAVSGGRGPWQMFALLEHARLDWSQIDVFQVDERVAPDGDPARNLTHLLASLPEGGRARVHPMPVTAPGSRDGDRRLRRRVCRRRSTSCISASAPTGTPHRWCRATTCSRSPTGASP